MILRLSVSADGIIFDEETQKAVGFIGRRKYPPHIAWADDEALDRVLLSAQAENVSITVKVPCPTCSHI